MLPDAIAVQWSVPVAEDFHARYSALSRTYRYVLYNHAVRPALLAGRTGWFHLPLDLEKMREAANCLVGEHDFSSFRSAQCQAKSPVRTMQSVAVHSRGAYLFFDFTANAFLHHMVRNIVGCLVYVGKGKHSPAWISELMAARDRRRAAPTFAADGLYLSCVRYDPRWSLPAFSDVLPTSPGPQPSENLRVKICGITRPEDAAAAAAHDGADDRYRVLPSEPALHVSLRSARRSPRPPRLSSQRWPCSSTPPAGGRSGHPRVRGHAASISRGRAAGFLRGVFAPIHQGRADSARTGFAKIPVSSQGRAGVDARCVS
jgi:hypothetical protein